MKLQQILTTNDDPFDETLRNTQLSEVCEDNMDSLLDWIEQDFKEHRTEPCDVRTDLFERMMRQNDLAGYTYKEALPYFGINGIARYIYDWLNHEIENLEEASQLDDGNYDDEVYCERQLELSRWHEIMGLRQGVSLSDCMEFCQKQMKGLDKKDLESDYHIYKHILSILRAYLAAQIKKDEPKDETAKGIPNLDCPDVDAEAWYVEMRGHFESLASYCEYKSCASSARAKGMMESARVDEENADKVYKTLPEWAKW